MRTDTALRAASVVRDDDDNVDDVQKRSDSYVIELIEQGIYSIGYKSAAKGPAKRRPGSRKGIYRYHQKNGEEQKKSEPHKGYEQEKKP